MIRMLLNWLLREPQGRYIYTMEHGHRVRCPVPDDVGAWELYSAIKRGEI
jgi:hypothetical protein